MYSSVVTKSISCVRMYISIVTKSISCEYSGSWFCIMYVHYGHGVCSLSYLMYQGVSLSALLSYHVSTIVLNCGVLATIVMRFVILLGYPSRKHDAMPMLSRPCLSHLNCKEIIWLPEKQSHSNCLQNYMRTTDVYVVHQCPLSTRSVVFLNNLWNLLAYCILVFYGNM